MILLFYDFAWGDITTDDLEDQYLISGEEMNAIYKIFDHVENALREFRGFLNDKFPEHNDTLDEILTLEPFQK